MKKYENIKINITIRLPKSYEIKDRDLCIDVFDTEELVCSVHANSDMSIYSSGMIETFGHTEMSVKKGRVVAYDKSKIYAYKQTRVELCDNAHGEAHEQSQIFVYNHDKPLVYENGTIINMIK